MSGVPGDGWSGWSDESLLGAATDDPDAFGEFYDRHVATFVRWFARRTACAQAAADLAAETFAEAYRTVHRYRPDRGAPRAWLFGIAQNHWRHYVRTGDVSTRALRRLGVSLDQHDHADAVAENLDLESLAIGVDAMLSDLSPPLADAVRLRVVHGLPFAEVAARLGCTEGAARVRVSRALARLQDNPDLADRYQRTFRIRWVS